MTFVASSVETAEEIGERMTERGHSLTSPGHDETAKAVPVTGTWKSMVSLQRSDEVMAAPIHLPADAEIGASAVPALPERTTSFVRNTDVLLREAKDGPALPTIAHVRNRRVNDAAAVGLAAVPASLRGHYAG